MLKFKNKILLLVFLLQIFSNFNNNVFCSRANNQGLLIANSIAKYGAFAASDVFGLKGDKLNELYFDNIYLALDTLDSMLKIDNLLDDANDDANDGAAFLALACNVGLLIYDIVLLGKNANELNKLKNDINNKKNKNKENNNIPNQVLTQSNKKKIFYTLLKHSAILADVASTIDFAGDSGRYTKSSEAILSVFLKLFSRSIDNKSAKIPNKALACLSAVASSFMTFVVCVNKEDEKYWKRYEEERRENDAYWGNVRREQEVREQAEIMAQEARVEAERRERMRIEALAEAARIARGRRAEEERLRREREDALVRFAPRVPSEKISLAELQGRYGERVEDRCSICTDTLDRNVLVTSVCHHVFCQECLSQWRAAGRSASNSCPNCREPIDGYYRAPIPFELIRE